MNKLPIGVSFHCGEPYYGDGIGAYFEKLIMNGHAVFGMGTDTAGIVYIVQELKKLYPKIPMYGVYRKTVFSWESDVPVYTADPKEHAERYWHDLIESWPKELDPEFVYCLFPNEPDQNEGRFLGELAYWAGLFAIEKGYKFVTPAFSGGEPEEDVWEFFKDYLVLCAKYPDRLGIATHEYNFDASQALLNSVPYHIGRIGKLNDYCQANHIALPLVFITEFGWDYDDAPRHEIGIPQILDTVQWYLNFAPNVKGVALWALDKDSKYGGLSKIINAYMKPLAEAIVNRSWIVPNNKPTIDLPIEDKPKIVIIKLAQEHDSAAWVAAAQKVFDVYPRTITASHDDMITMLEAGNLNSKAIVVDPEMESQKMAIGLLKKYKFKYEVRYFDNDKPFHRKDIFKYRPCDTDRITQLFGANPDNYSSFLVPGHDGIDFGVSKNYPFYAVQDGKVVRAGNLLSNGQVSAWGYHVVIRHEIDGLVFHTGYGHAAPELPVRVGDTVKAGDIVGLSGNSGNSTGYHLHFGLLWPTDPGNGYPKWLFGYPVDPFNYLVGKEPPVKKFKFDLLPYLMGDGRLYEVKNSQGGQERFQTQWFNDNEFWQTKNGNAEQMFFDESYIYRGWDTSPGGDRFFKQTEEGLPYARWIPRHMAIGGVFSVSLHVQFFYDSCEKMERFSGDVTDSRKFINHHPVWMSRAGIRLANVIELEWINGGERYFYAKDYGLVGWERNHQDPHTPEWSAISEIHGPGARPDNVVILPECLKR